jgi:Protein of unknown function (DUF2911)
MGVRSRSSVVRGRQSVVFLFLLLLAPTACADAQPGRRSQRATVTQSLSGTEISIRYYRPVLRGRVPFPDVVPWGRTWTPGADSATRIETSGDLLVQDSVLAAGKYSIWVIPEEHDAWTVIFSREHNVFHTSYPGGQDALRVQAKPTTGPSMETLGFYFPLVDADSAVLAIQWGTTVLPLRLRAKTPSR